MNLKMLLVAIALLGSIFALGQDFDVYPRLQDDKLERPDVYENMLFEDFQLLSRNVRMMDMAYSAVVPGYIHFKAHENKMGYYLLGTRLAGYAGIAINYARLNDAGQNYADLINGRGVKTSDKVIFASSMAFIFGSYIFDWIHGKARLEKKQEMVRYRHSIKLKMSEQSHSKGATIPSFSVQYKF